MADYENRISDTDGRQPELQRNAVITLSLVHIHGVTASIHIRLLVEIWSGNGRLVEGLALAFALALFAFALLAHAFVRLDLAFALAAVAIIFFRTALVPCNRNASSNVD